MQREIDKIRASLTSERVADEVDAVRAQQFSPLVDKWVNGYQKVGLRKDLFVFRWCYRINQSWIVLDVFEDQKERLRDIKSLLNMFVILIDDISEQKDGGRLLEELLKIPFYPASISYADLNEVESEYLEFTTGVWNEIDSNVKRLPNYETFNNSYYFDIFQLISAVRYGKYITDSMFHMNELEYFQYFPNSMQIIINADLDLMSSKQFDEKEEGLFRELILTTQKMARIGNWLTTWEREVKAGDYTSVVVPYCYYRDEIALHDFEDINTVVEKIRKSDAEEHYLNKWQKLYERAQTTELKISSVKKDQVMDRFRYLIGMHLISKNLK